MCRSAEPGDRVPAWGQTRVNNAQQCHSSGKRRLGVIFLKFKAWLFHFEQITSQRSFRAAFPPRYGVSDQTDHCWPLALPFPRLSLSCFLQDPSPRMPETRRKPYPELSALAALSCRAAACGGGGAPAVVVGWLQAKSIICGRTEEMMKTQILFPSASPVKASVPPCCGRIQPFGGKWSKDTPKPLSSVFLLTASNHFPWAAHPCPKHICLSAHCLGVPT